MAVKEVTELEVNGRRAVENIRVVKRSLDDMAGSADRARDRLGRVGSGGQPQFRKFSDELRSMRSQLDGFGGALAKGGGGLSGFTSMLRSASSPLGLLAGGIGAAGLAAVSFTSAIAKAGDATNAMLGRLKAATGSAAAASDTFKQLYDSAQRLGVGVEDTIGGFTRFAIAGRQVGATRDEVVRLTETIQKFGVAGGSSTSELQAATMQLGQALASGRLQGDELRSIMENMPLLAENLAKQLNVSVGQLRDMGSQGELTSDKVFKALLASGKEADKLFAQMPDTLERAGNRISNAWQASLAEIDKSIGASEKLLWVLKEVEKSVTRLGEGVAPETTQGLLQRLQSDRASVGAKRDDYLKRTQADPAFGVISRSEDLREFDRKIELLNSQISATQRLADAEQRVADRRKVAESATAAAQKHEAEMATARTNLKDVTKDLLTEEQKIQAEYQKRVKAITAARDAGVSDVDGKAIDYTRLLTQAEADRTAGLEKLALAKGKASREALEIDQKEREQQEAAVKTVDEQIAGLQRERDELSLTARERYILGETLKAEKTLRDGLITDTASFVQTIREEAAATYDLQEAKTGLLADQARTLEYIEAETRLMGESEEVRSRELALLKQRQDLLASGKSLDSEYGRQAMANAEKIERMTRSLDAQKAVMQELEDFGTRTFDRIGSAITQALATGEMKALKFGNIIRAVVSEILQEFIKLAAINPLKNMLFGGNAPTMGGVMNLFGGLSPSVGGAAPGGSAGAGGGVMNGIGGGGLGQFFGGTGTSGSALNWLFGAGPTGNINNPASYVPGTSGVLGSGGNILGIEGFTPGVGLGALGAIGGVANFAMNPGIGSGLGAIGGGLGLVSALVPSLSALGPIGVGLGIVGSLVGGLFKKKPKTPAYRVTFGQQNGDIVGKRTYGRKGAGEGNALNPLKDAVSEGVEGLVAQYGGTLDSSRNDVLGPGHGVRFNWSKKTGYWVRGGNMEREDFGKEGLEEAVQETIFRMFKTSSIQGLGRNARLAKRNSSAGDLDAFTKDLTFGQNVDDIVAGNGNDLKIQRIQLNRQMEIELAAFEKQAKSLGIGGKDLAAALDYTKKKYTDQLDALDKQILALTDASDATKMYTQAQLQASQQLKGWLDAQKLSDISSLSNTDRFAEAQRQFGLAQVDARKTGEVGGLTQAAETLLRLGQGMFGGATKDFVTLEQMVRSTIESLGRELKLPGFATGGIVRTPTVAHIAEGGMVEAVIPLPNGRSVQGHMTGFDMSSVVEAVSEQTQATVRALAQQTAALVRSVENLSAKVDAQAAETRRTGTAALVGSAQRG